MIHRPNLHDEHRVDRWSTDKAVTSVHVNYFSGSEGRGLHDQDLRTGDQEGNLSWIELARLKNDEDMSTDIRKQMNRSTFRLCPSHCHQVVNGRGFGDPHAVTANLSPAPQSNVTLCLHAMDGTAVPGSDYSIIGVTGQTGAVEVSAGASTVDIPVSIADDNAVEGNETILLTLTEGTGYTVGSQRTPRR